MQRFGKVNVAVGLCLSLKNNFSLCDEGGAKNNSGPHIATNSSHAPVTITVPETSKVSPLPSTNSEEGTEAAEEDDDEDDEDFEEKSNCSFCKMFLASPCASQFKAWSKCVRKSKKIGKDLAEYCKEVSTDLFKCTGENKEYFEALSAAQEVEGEEGEADDHDEGNSLSEGDASDSSTVTEVAR